MNSDLQSHAMLSTIAHSYGDVQRILQELGAPAPGTQRVYRGQSRSHKTKDGSESIIPALQRGDRLGYDAGWLVKTTRMLRLTLENDNDGLPIEMSTLWAPALLQQYGPGSYYVDVSFDATISLWFALHRYRERWMSMRVGSETRGIFDRWILTNWYDDGDDTNDEAEPVTDETLLPVLYVFDQPLWDGIVSPKFGALVDLLSSPTGEWFRQHAVRVTRQRGALLHANPTLTSHGDVGPLARAAIRLAPDFDRGSIPGIHRPTHHVFPLPSEDPVYRILLAQPAHLHFAPTRIEHPLNISWYFSATPNIWHGEGAIKSGGNGTRSDPTTVVLANNLDPDRGDWNTELADYFRSCDNVTPVFLLPEIKETADAVMEVGFALVSLSDALPLVMESVLYISTPAAGSDASPWIESALPLGVADAIDGHSTSSVYFELAPIDFIDITEDYWNAAPRAFWMVRQQHDYYVRTFRQNATTLQVHTWHFTFDTESGKFLLVSTSLAAESEGVAEAEAAVARKVLLLGLAVLRDLSPGWKPPAQHDYTETDRSSGKPVYRHKLDGILIPQRAQLVPIAHGRYFTPRALNGQAYHLGVRTELVRAPDAEADERAVLQHFLPALRDRSYLAVAAPRLVMLHAANHDWGAIVELVNVTVPILHGDPQFRIEESWLLLSELRALLTADLGHIAVAKIALTLVTELLGELSAAGTDVHLLQQDLQELSTQMLKNNE